ncbi:MAG: CapA family protein [Candidatus Dormibacteraeota bacterium]|nr:CapA family protein [Candidatus Dormibacteraeota bacterium]
MSIFLAGVGDLVVTRPLRHVRDQPDDSLLHVLARADFAVGNLEGPLTGAEAGGRGETLLRGAPELMSDVVAMGIDAVSLANNHAADPGWDSLHEMVQDLELAGLVTLGVGGDTADAFQPELQNVHGVEVALLAATCVGRKAQHAGPERPGIAGVRVRTRYEPDASRLEWEPATPPRTITSIEPEDRGRLLRAVGRARDLSSFVAVTMHWGVSWAEQPVAYQRELGRDLVEAGASVVFGSHSQTLHGVEVHRGAPIFYGLGSFVFNHRGQVRRRVPGDTAVALVEVEGDGRVASARLLLGRLDAEGEPVRAHAERAELLAEILARSSAGWAAPARLEGDTLKIDLR